MTLNGPQGKTAVYRLYDSADVLLYVGSSCRPADRYGDHRRLTEWWPEVVRRDVVWYPTRVQGEEAERVAIREELPKHNMRGNPDRPRPYPTRLTVPEPTATAVFHLAMDSGRRLDDIITEALRDWLDRDAHPERTPGTQQLQIVFPSEVA